MIQQHIKWSLQKLLWRKFTWQTPHHHSLPNTPLHLFRLMMYKSYYLPFQWLQSIPPLREGMCTITPTKLPVWLFDLLPVESRSLGVVIVVYFMTRYLKTVVSVASDGSTLLCRNYLPLQTTNLCWVPLWVLTLINPRYVVASRDLAAGEVVLRGSPFCATAEDHLKTTVCCVCFAFSPNKKYVFSCKKCNEVWYCSQACETKGIYTTHATH